MNGWMAQWYLNVPAWGKVCWNVVPTAMFFESHAPSSAVVVCVTLSLFVHVTVWPGATVIDCGAKANPAIVTPVPPVAGAGAAPVTAVPVACITISGWRTILRGALPTGIVAIVFP